MRQLMSKPKKELESFRKHRIDLGANWRLLDNPPERIDRPCYQGIWTVAVWDMLEKVEYGARVKTLLNSLYGHPSRLLATASAANHVPMVT